jgi:hypothetical protein
LWFYPRHQLDDLSVARTELIAISVILVAVVGAILGTYYGEGLLGSLKSSSLPHETTLVDQDVPLKIVGAGGGYSWTMMALSSGASVSVSVQSNNTVFTDLSEDRADSLKFECVTNPNTAIPQALIHDNVGTTNRFWTVKVSESCNYTLSVSPPYPTYYDYGQTVNAHVTVKETL